jgi:hypothetical protein
MTTVARDQRKPASHVSALADIVRAYVGSPPSDQQQMAAMSFDQIVRLRIRRVLALLGSVLCGFELSELGVALDIHKSVVCRDLAEVQVGLRAQADELGLDAEAIFPPRASTPSVVEEGESEEDGPALVNGTRRRSDWIQSLRREDDVA